jgi:hypothetical protein
VSGYLRPQDTNANAGTSGLTLAASKGTALFYGSVLDTLGNPIQGVEVGASDNNNLYEGDAYTDANGNYVTVALGGLTNDSWWVGINQSASNYVFSQPAIEQNGNASINAGEALQANFTGVPAALHHLRHPHRRHRQPLRRDRRVRQCHDQRSQL